MSAPKVIIGTIAYGAVTAPYLPLFKKSLAEQTFRDFELVIHDNTEDNLGFSRAYNSMMNKAAQKGAEYFLVINPDIRLEPNALAVLTDELMASSDVTCVVPKIRQWDFKNNALTNIIDSCGLGFFDCLNFYDIGQGQLDQGQYDNDIPFGPGGAAALFKLKDLETIKEGNCYFDEHFFMYKEDCDLAYRMHLAGLKTKLAPQAVMYHDRTSAAGGILKRFVNRFGRSKQVNRWAFINHHYLFIKYWRLQSFKAKCLAIIRMKLMFFEALVFEQYLLSCYRIIIKEMKTLKRY